MSPQVLELSRREAFVSGRLHDNVAFTLQQATAVRQTVSTGATPTNSSVVLLRRKAPTRNDEPSNSNPSKTVKGGRKIQFHFPPTSFFIRHRATGLQLMATAGALYLGRHQGLNNQKWMYVGHALVLWAILLINSYCRNSQYIVVYFQFNARYNSLTHTLAPLLERDNVLTASQETHNESADESASVATVADKFQQWSYKMDAGQLVNVGTDKVLAARPCALEIASVRQTSAQLVLNQQRKMELHMEQACPGYDQMWVLIPTNGTIFF